MGESVLGASHQRHGLPNQDAIHWSAEDGGPVVAAVSDGHGSAKCFRSDTGSRIAVETAVELLTAFVRRHPNAPASSQAGSGRAAEELRERLVQKWNDRVAEHLRSHPFSKNELAKVEERDGAAARRVVDTTPTVAYGATLLATAITDHYVIHLQLGDGDILTVTDAGEVSRPVEADSRLMANETTSLCSPTAARDIRITVTNLHPAPALVLLSTDGYANSFRDDPSFTRVGTDLLKLVCTRGAEHVAQNLNAWLTEASTHGSGDDVTLGLVVRRGLGAGDTSVSRKPPQRDPGERSPASNGGSAHAQAEDTVLDEEWVAWSRSVSRGMERLSVGILCALFASGFSFGVAVLLLAARFLARH